MCSNFNAVVQYLLLYTSYYHRIYRENLMICSPGTNNKSQKMDTKHTHIAESSLLFSFRRLIFFHECWYYDWWQTKIIFHSNVDVIFMHFTIARCRYLFKNHLIFFYNVFIYPLKCLVWFEREKRMKSGGYIMKFWCLLLFCTLQSNSASILPFQNDEMNYVWKLKRFYFLVITK